MHLKNLIRLSFVVLLVGTMACRRSLDPPSWDVDVLAPIAYTTLTIGDLIPDSLQQQNADSSLTLVYDDNLYRVSLSEIVEIPDTSIVESFTLPFGSTTIAPGAQIYSGQQVTEFDAQGAELTELLVRNGTIEFTLTSTISQPHVLRYEILRSGFGGPNGIPFTATIQMPAGSQANPATVTDTRNMNGYYIDLRGPNGNEFNQMETLFEISNGATSDSVLIQAGDNATVSSTFKDVTPQCVRGYFGSELVDVTPDGSNSIELFNRIVDGTIDIDDIDLTLELVNGVGADARVEIDGLTAINNSSGNTVDLNHSIIGSTVNLTRAQENAGVITPSTYSVNLNPGNSNVDLFLENLPDEVDFDLDFTLNPLGNVSNGHDFLYHNSELAINLNAEFPLCLLANNLTLSDTVDIDLVEDSITGRVNSGTLYIIAENGFPLSVDLQLYLLDGAGNQVDSFIVAGSLPAGVTDANRIVTARTPSRVQLTLSEAQMNEIYQGNRRLELRAVFNTPEVNPPHYKLYSHYDLKLTVTVDANYTVELE